MPFIKISRKKKKKMDVEECSVTESIRQVVEHGLQTGKFDDPRLTQQLIASMRKKEKAIKIRKERVKRASASSESESSEDTVPIRLYTGNDAFNPTVLSSTIKNKYEDDTPVYEEVISSGEEEEEETSDERELIRCMAAVCLKISEDEERTTKEEALAEIKKELDAMGMGRDRLFNLAWRSMFIMTNTSETLNEEDLAVFLDNYCA